MVDTLIYQGLIGLSYSMYLWLIAAGLTIVFGVLGVLNFAHGALYMLGAYLAFTLYGMLGLNFWISLLLSIISVGAIGGLMERFFLRPIYNLELPYQLILTYAFILIFDDLVKMIWGPIFRIPGMPGSLQGSISLFGRGYPIYSLFLLGAGVAVALLIWLLLEKTWWGKTISACVSHREMAGVLGLNVPVILTTVFMFGAALAAFGGALSIPMRVVVPGLGALVIVQAFIVTVIGGLGSLKGAFVGALIVGLLSSYGVLIIPVFELFLSYAAMAVVLLVRPEGIFGGK